MLNILFITLLDMRSVDEHNLYSDLMREFARHGHNVYIVSPIERRYGQPTQLLEDKTDELRQRVHILKLRSGNIQKTNLVEKGVSTLLLENQLVRGIKKYFSSVHFDLVLFSTPPITLLKPVSYIKKRYNARAYLMLKDIFPQNAVDLGMMKEGGLLHRYFRAKEKRLYEISDRIGCMSPANVAYVLRHNPEIPGDKVELCPNSIEVREYQPVSEDEKQLLRKWYGLPADKRVFVYGGNLGKPQDVPFIIRCLEACRDIPEAFFLIVGSGTDYPLLENYVKERKPAHVMLLPSMPEEEYDRMLLCCDVGLIFLDHRFTIPNFPSRLLSYMQAGLPVLACTDRNTDIGKVIVEGGFGWWCESDDSIGFAQKVDNVVMSDTRSKGLKAKEYLIRNYSAETCSNIINVHL